MRSGGCSISIISPTAPFVASGLVLFRTILNLVADPKSPHANSVLIFVVEFYPCGFEKFRTTYRSARQPRPSKAGFFL